MIIWPFPSIDDVYLPTTVYRFLLVSLTIENILGEMTICQRRKKLEEMAQGNGLSDAYTATLTRLKAQGGSRAGLGLKALMWVLYSERPLRVEELCHALGVEIGSEDLDLENIPESQTLLSSCLGLITVDVSSSTIRLVHFTLQEYLLRDPALFHSSHSTISETCLTYLNFGLVRNLSPTLDSAPSAMPLLEYASLYWGKHTRLEMTENVKTLALRLLDRFDEHISAQLLLLSYERHNFLRLGFDKAEGPAGFTGLHGVAYLGIVEVVAAVLRMKEWDVNGVDCTGSTALTWAALRGQQEVVKALLEREDVNPNKADTKHGRTPISWAAGNGHEGIVKVLLERKDVNPNKADIKHGRTPLSWAAGNGHKGVVKVLLEREDVNLDQADTQYGRVPLSWAAGSGHEEVVKTLLEREGINPDNADSKDGRTPLSLAAGRGREGVVKILLEREDVDPEKEDAQNGRVPLSWAAGCGHERVVKILLEQEDVDPNRGDTKFGRTPLSWAAERGRERAVKVLLEQKSVNPDYADAKCGRTPLSWAAEKGREGVVKLLLEREDVNPDQADTEHGRVPLSWAAGKGHQRVVKVLLQREDVNPNHADSNGRTPLSRAAEKGHEGVVKLLLEKKDVNPDQADTLCGQTPLSWAAEKGHEGVVKLLLEREDVNPDRTDTKYGRKPLLWATRNRHEEIVKMLSERGDFRHSPMPDSKNQSLPPLAPSEGHDGVARSLPECDDVDSDKANHGGQAFFKPSAQPPDEFMMEMQLGSHDPNADLISLHSQRDLPPAAHDDPRRLLDPQDSISISADRGPSTQSPWWSQPLSIWPLKLCCGRRKTKTQPSNT